MLLRSLLRRSFSGAVPEGSPRVEVEDVLTWLEALLDTNLVNMVRMPGRSPNPNP